MKLLGKFIVILTVLALVFCAFSCGGEEENNKKENGLGDDFDIVGVYTCDASGVSRWEFKDDKSFEISRSATNTSKGKWSLKGNELNMTLDPISGQKIPSDILKVSSSGTDEITLESTSQVPAVFARISFAGKSVKLVREKEIIYPSMTHKNTNYFEYRFFYDLVEDYAEIVKIEKIDYVIEDEEGNCFDAFGKKVVDAGLKISDNEAYYDKRSKLYYGYYEVLIPDLIEGRKVKVLRDDIDYNRGKGGGISGTYSNVKLPRYLERIGRNFIIDFDYMGIDSAGDYVYYLEIPDSVNYIERGAFVSGATGDIKIGSGVVLFDSDHYSGNLERSFVAKSRYSYDVWFEKAYNSRGREGGLYKYYYNIEAYRFVE